jgi:hypothetical protein
MAATTERELDDVAPGALAVARRYLISGGDIDTAMCSDAELLRRLGVFRPDGALIQAGRNYAVRRADASATLGRRLQD